MNSIGRARPAANDGDGAIGMKTSSAFRDAAAPLIAHVIYRLDIGGMENGLINLINHMPPERYRHAIVCLTEYTDYRKRLRRSDVECFALHKRAGKDLAVYPRLWRLLRRLRPAIVHTRNLPALDSLAVAALAGVRRRVHGEHGRDVIDRYGASRKYLLLRRLLRPLARQYVAVSRDLAQWLHSAIGVADARVTQIYTGVDTARFHPAPRGRIALPPESGTTADSIVIGTIGRMQTVKDQPNLARAFAHLLRRLPHDARLRLVMIGDGPLRAEVERLLIAAGVRERCWLPGMRDDTPELLRGFDVFVLPSAAEGISNTILEAMASGLPVVATRVGGNPELVVDGETGTLVPSADPVALASALERYIENPARARRHGQAGRARVERAFSMESMARGYMTVYDALLNGDRGMR